MRKEVEAAIAHRAMLQFEAGEVSTDARTELERTILVARERKLPNAVAYLERRLRELGSPGGRHLRVVGNAPGVLQ
jgi:hypothetical protein